MLFAVLCAVQCAMFSPISGPHLFLSDLISLLLLKKAQQATIPSSFFTHLLVRHVLNILYREWGGEEITDQDHENKYEGLQNSLLTKSMSVCDF